MTEILSGIMGSMDILAGVLIMFAFHFSTFAVIFSILMIGKGLISFF